MYCLYFTLSGQILQGLCPFFNTVFEIRSGQNKRAKKGSAFLVIPTNRRLRYAAALRETMARRLARQGVTPRLLGRLRRVLQYESRFRSPYCQTVAAREFSDELLSAAQLCSLGSGQTLAVRLTGGETVALDCERYRQLLLALFRAGCRSGGKALHLTFCEREIALRCEGFSPDRTALRFAALLRAQLLRLRGGRAGALLLLPVAPAEAPAEPTPTLAEYLRDPLSEVYLYAAP